MRRRARVLRGVGLATAALLTATALTGFAPAAQAATPVGLANGALGAKADPAPETAAEKIKPGLAKRLAKTGTADFWVRFERDVDLGVAGPGRDWDERGADVVEKLKKSAAEHQKEVVAALEKRKVTYRTFWATDAVYVENGSDELAATLAAVPAVDGLWPTQTYKPVEPVDVKADRATTAAAVEWGVANIKADQVWADGDTGKGIVIANIDSGVQYDHPALVKQYRGNNGDGTFTHDYNWLDTNSSCDGGPCDKDGHGTHTMGTMVGSDGGTNQIGVAPGATWITANGCATCSDVDLIEAGQWMLAPTKTDGTGADPARRPHIINNSWGTQTPSNDPFMEDISTAWAASGIFAIWSNGNIGPECQTAGSPGSRTINYSVGAYDVNNVIGSFSSRGSGQDGGIKPNISAPGVNVRSAVPGGTYGVKSGTSMAAPHVAGALGLLWSAHPDLIGDLAATEEMLDGTAIDTEDLQCGGTADDNNVYGEGRLDAVALLEAGDRGPIGTLAGDVTEDADGSPLADATVHVTGGTGDDAVERDLAVDGEGHFAATLPIGEYDVTASSFGFAEAAETVTVTEGRTTTQDFALRALPTSTVTGTVTDGSGQGWPLYAEVRVAGAPKLTQHTDPRDGSFSLELPEGTTYDLSVDVDYPGYEKLTQSIEVSEDATVNLAVPVQQRPCVAPGYHQEQPRIAVVTNDPGFEARDFFGSYGIEYTTFTTTQLGQIDGFDLVVWMSNYNLPDSAAFRDLLARTDASGTGIVFADFAFGVGNGVAALSAATGNPVSLQRRNASGSGTYYEVTQKHPVLEGLEVGDRIDHLGGAQTAWFTGYTGDGVQVLAGAGDKTRGVSGPGIAVQQRPGNRHVLLSMHARGAGSWLDASEKVFWNAMGWADTSERSFGCVPDEDGAMLVGSVTDANTGDGVVGARVSIGDATTESAATPEDADLADGFYWLYSPRSGDQHVTVAASKYSTWTDSVSLEGLTVKDVELAAGRLSLSADSVEITRGLGDASGSQEVTITNTGTAPAQVRIGERERGFVLQTADGSTVSRDAIGSAEGAPVRRLDVPVSVGAATKAAEAELTAQPQSAPWTGIADYPTPVMDNAMVRLDGKIYSIAGYGSAGPLAAVWVYDPADMTWSEAAPLPAPRSGMTAGVIDGHIVATGGWDAANKPQGDTWVYDPGADAWSPGATNPAPRAGASGAVVNGQLFAIGGCTTADCAPMTADVVAYDPVADAWEPRADYPLALAYAACGTIDWTIYCAGGIGSSTTNKTFAYDPGADTWAPKADVPVDVWGSGYSVANDQLVLVGGIQQGQVTNQAFGYDPATNAWSGMPSANNVRYRGGAACGFYSVGGSAQGYTPGTAAEMLPGYDQCDAGTADVGWLSVDQTSATVEPGESVELTVSVDPTVDQPGTYTAGLAILESTPYQQAEVGVDMIVTPPKTWGKLVGTVRGVACDGSSRSLSGATLQLDARGMSGTFSTGPDGTFARWIDKQHNPLTVAAAYPGYSIESERVRIQAGKTVEAMLDLDKAGC
ncbi:S8 family serine peptidase [Nocardioides sp. CCNWLW239]|uniref:S8 family serine peptidase n=1 Tax=Nocardioides sp. CCNWLW239 TaxID=3128902 RepID=UPI00301771E2